MRRLNRQLREERGASAILVGLLIIPIMGFAAIALDVGALYFERAQLQHAADAAAMAVATKCSVNRCPSDFALAGEFANGNARDGAVEIADQEIDRGARTVRIDVTTLNADSTQVIRHPFAAAAGIDVDGTTVSATATAKWAAGNATLPLALTTCEFEITDAGSGELRWVTYDTNKECKGDPAEPEVPGGFGWLDLLYDGRDPVGCIAEIDTDGAAGSRPGNSGLPNDRLEAERVCHGTFTEALAGQTVYVPLADSSNGLSGNNAKWHIREYGRFVLRAWNFSGGSSTALPDMYLPDTPDDAGIQCLRNCNGVLVEFLGFAPLGSVPGSDISTTIILVE